MPEGFALYNFLQSLPVKLTMVNIGTIQFIANIVYLAADTRLACEDTDFILHSFERIYRQEKVAHRVLLEDNAILEREKSSFLGILKRRTKITTKTLNELKLFEKQIIVNTSMAKKMGLIQKVQKIVIPQGSKIWNVEYKG